MHQDNANCGNVHNRELTLSRSVRCRTSVMAAHVPHRTINIVIESVARAFAVTPQALKSRRRGVANVALARQVAMYLAHVACGVTLTEAGDTFRRDRTTVAHACKRVEDLREAALFDWRIERIERSIEIYLTLQASWEAA